MDDDLDADQHTLLLINSTSPVWGKIVGPPVRERNLIGSLDNCSKLKRDWPQVRWSSAILALRGKAQSLRRFDKLS